MQLAITLAGMICGHYALWRREPAKHVLGAEWLLGLSLASVSAGTPHCEAHPPLERPVLTAPSLGWCGLVVTGQVQYGDVRTLT
jgi:peptidoglycan/LPS O-acetylase OafA/YrhL